jgi:serine/threonine protein kinase
MPNPSNSNPPHPIPSEIRSGTDRQETLLLSDVSNATLLTQEVSAAQILTPSLSSAALIALSQRYDILAEAGHGAMGNVYKARDRETGETVALKLLRPEIASDQVMIERFKNELLFARKITHKNVCRVFEFNRVGGIAYTSMEFVEGESLRAVLNRSGAFPARKGLELALQICYGLKEAHAQGIVHRDLKPENVMIDSNGNVKIMDFGIARSMEALTRLTGSMIGTPAYMAPEQVAGKPVDYRTDIYSLGLMLYEMFTGSQAFHADTAVALALKQMRETPPLPHDVQPSIPAVIERAILKCLEKEPEKRYQSVGELANVLRSTGVSGPAADAPTIVPQARAVHATTSIPQAALAAQREPKRTSPFVWILVGALFATVALGALRANKVWSTARKASLPTTLPAPLPPAFAFDPVLIPPPATSAPAAKSAGSHASKKSPAAPAKLEKSTVTPAHATQPAAPPTVQPLRSSGLAAQQQRSEKILARDGITSSANNATYLWVGRYEKEEMAQKNLRKLRGLSQAAFMVTKTVDGKDFYVLFVGPVAEKSVSDTSEWLESQGFRNVKPAKHPYFGAKPEKNPAH